MPVPKDVAPVAGFGRTIIILPVMIHLRLFKVAAMVVASVRRVHMRMAGAFIAQPSETCEQLVR